MKNKKLWIIILILGIVPFIIPIISGIYSFINGFSGLCISINCKSEYGFSALIGTIILYSFVFWPTYIIGSILIIISIIKIKKLNKKVYTK